MTSALKEAGRCPRQRQVAQMVLLLVLGWFAPRLLYSQEDDLFHESPFWDTSRHLANVYAVRQRLFPPPPEARTPADVPPELAGGGISAGKDPLTLYLLCSLPALLTGSETNALAWMMNLASFALLAGALFGLGRRLGPQACGLWAALLCALHPSLLASSLTFCPEFPLAAVVALSLLLLLRSAGFTRPGPVAALAITAGLGLGIKLSYALYLAGPALLVLAQGLQRPAARRRVAALCGACVACALVTWAEVHLMVLGQLDVQNIRFNFSSHVLSPELWTAIPIWTLAGLLAIPTLLLVGYMPGPLLLLLPALVSLHRARPSAGRKLTLVAVWGSLLLLALVTVKLERYLHPVYPLLLLVSARWALTRLTLWRRRAALAGLVGVLLLHLELPGYALFDTRDRAPAGGDRTIAAQLLWRTLYEARLTPLYGAIEQPPWLDANRARLVRALRQGLVAASRQLPDAQPLVIAEALCSQALYAQRHLPPTPSTVCAAMPPSRGITLLAISIFPGRRVTGVKVGGPSAALQLELQHTPHVLILHAPALAPEQVAPGLRLRWRQVSPVLHSGGRVQLVFSLCSLLEPRRPGRAERPAR